MLIGSIFIAASIVAVALTTLCLIIKSLCKFFSVKRAIYNSEGIGSTEATRIEDGHASSAETEGENSSTKRSPNQTLENKETSSRHRGFVTVMNGRELDMGSEQYDPREGGSRRDQESVRHARNASRRDRVSVRRAGHIRVAPSLPAFKNTRRLKLSTLVFVLYSAFFNFISQLVVMHFSGNIILVKSVQLIITSFSPLVIILMEKDILSFVRELLKGDAFN